MTHTTAATAQRRHDRLSLAYRAAIVSRLRLNALVGDLPNGMSLAQYLHRARLADRRVVRAYIRWRHSAKTAAWLAANINALTSAINGPGALAPTIDAYVAAVALSSQTIGTS